MENIKLEEIIPFLGVLVFVSIFYMYLGKRPEERNKNK
jgi:hypothetical protein